MSRSHAERRWEPASFRTAGVGPGAGGEGLARPGVPGLLRGPRAAWREWRAPQRAALVLHGCPEGVTQTPWQTPAQLRPCSSRVSGPARPRWTELRASAASVPPGASQGESCRPPPRADGPRLLAAAGQRAARRGHSLPVASFSVFKANCATPPASAFASLFRG